MQRGFQEAITAPPRPERRRVVPLSTRPTQGRLQLHTALRSPGPTHRIAGSQSASYTGTDTILGVRLRTRAGLHGNRVGSAMPLAGALNPQAHGPPLPASRCAVIPDGVLRADCDLRASGEAAVEGADALPPSTHPKLGVTSRRQRFHRYALQRIFRPSLRRGESDYGYCVAA